MDAMKKPEKIAASLSSAGAPDLARRLIEAFNLEDDLSLASMLDDELTAQAASLRGLIPDEAFEDDEPDDG